MKKIFAIIIITLIYFFMPASVFGQTPVSQSSAHYINTKDAVPDKRAVVLKNFLKKYKSPLEKDAETIVKTADEQGIPWTWIPAISGVESTRCHPIPDNSYNCWGWNKGSSSFKDYNEAVTVISSSLKKNYVDRGADTIDKIAPIYAPPSHTWAYKVNYFITRLESFEKTDTSVLSISL